MKLYDSLSGEKRDFVPINAPYVGMYVCGPTVYGPAHLGHARSAITFDILFRYLTHKGYLVKFIRNYTDVGHLEYDADDGEDKVAKKARLENVQPIEIVQRYINNYIRDISSLNVLRPNIEPHASGHISEQISITKRLIDKGFAYEVNGSVYFDVVKYDKIFKFYGKLSGRNINELLQNTRQLEGQVDKHNSVDFALWKKASPLHMMQWESPWGMGFPGWHTECVAMSEKYLGTTFDIHGGGIDLKFPHHEAEMAQAMVLNNSPLANYWIHNNLVDISGQKMSKSLGNYITLEELFNGTKLTRKYSPMVLRFLFLQAHYRSTISFTEQAMEAAEKGYFKLMNTLKIIKELSNNTCNDDSLIEKINNCYEALDDDLNTAVVLSTLFEISKTVNDIKNGVISYTRVNTDLLKQQFISIVQDILGLIDTNDHDEYIDILMRIYKRAKMCRDYELVDMIRSELKKLNLTIKDHKNGEYSWGYNVTL